jgi:hypothetical protein
MVEEYYNDIVEVESHEISAVLANNPDFTEDYIYSTLKESFEKFLRLGYFKGVDDCKSAADHLRKVQEQGA